jgi:hypothetical protein
MNRETLLARSIDADLIKMLFRKFSGVYGNLWNSRCSTVQEWQDCVNVWLEGLKGFDVEVLRRGVSQAFIAHKNFPPTLGQLVDVCLHLSGIPSESMLIEAMVRRDFNHPLIKAVYDRIGSWALSHDKPEETIRKVRAVYSEVLNGYMEHPKESWLALEEFKALPSPEAIPSKMLSHKEIMGWKEQLAQYQRLASVDKAKLKPVNHPQWDVQKVTIGHRGFDENAHKARKDYLMGLDEQLAMTLSTSDQYDRIKFIRENLATVMIESYTRGIPITQSSKIAPMQSYGHRKTNDH